MNSQNLAMALRIAYYSVHRQTNAHLKKFGITADQFVCLFIIDEKKKVTQQQLVRAASSDPNTIRAMLLLLEKKGLITRSVHPDDKRAWLISLSRKGKNHFARMVEALVPVKEKMLGLFKAAEINALLIALNKLSDELY